MSLGSVTLRPSQRRPEHSEGVGTISTDPYHRIEFKHPAYPSGYDIFLTLPAIDHPNGGLHYNTAKIACGIIADNRWDGHFKTERDGEALGLSDDDILPCGAYYFFLPGYSYDQIDASYPITPSFTEWRFPHNHLPPNWQRPPEVHPNYPSRTHSDASVAVILRDRDQCRASGFKPMGCTDISMIQVDGANNLMLLRADLHQSFDTEQKFVFCPKKPEPHASNMVVHLTSYSEEHAWLYHNTISYSLDSVSREYLFARFAWAILPKVEPFLLYNVERLLITAAKGQHLAGPDDCKGYTVPRSTRSGTGSPEKRQRQAQSSENHDLEVDQLLEGDRDGRCSKRAKTLPAQPASHNKPSIGVPPSISCSSTRVHDPSDPTNLPLPEWEHFLNLREQALEKERERSDPHGQWLEEWRWAMDTLTSVGSAKNDMSSWADQDEAYLVLGIVDDSRAWVEEEDKGVYHR